VGKNEVGLQRDQFLRKNVASLPRLPGAPRPLDQREVAKRVAHRAAQRLGPVNDEQAGDIRFKPARDQVGQQRQARRFADTQGGFRRVFNGLAVSFQTMY